MGTRWHASVTRPVAVADFHHKAPSHDFTVLALPFLRCTVAFARASSNILRSVIEGASIREAAEKEAARASASPDDAPVHAALTAVLASVAAGTPYAAAAPTYGTNCPNPNSFSCALHAALTSASYADAVRTIILGGGDSYVPEWRARTLVRCGDLLPRRSIRGSHNNNCCCCSWFSSSLSPPPSHPRPTSMRVRPNRCSRAAFAGALLAAAGGADTIPAEWIAKAHNVDKAKGAAATLLA